MFQIDRSELPTTMQGSTSTLVLEDGSRRIEISVKDLLTPHLLVAERLEARAGEAVVLRWSQPGAQLGTEWAYFDGGQPRPYVNAEGSALNVYLVDGGAGGR
jgi:hypothetical protein